MPMQVGCGGCGKKYSVPEDWAGKAVRCKACGATIRIPHPVAPAEVPPAQPLAGAPAGSDPTADLFGDLPAGEIPGAAVGPTLTSMKPKRRKQSNLPPVGDSIVAFIRSDFLNTAVAIGMGLVLLSSLALLVTSGISGGLIANGLVFVGGFVIIVGGLRKVRRSRDDVGARAGRVAAWFAGGIMGIACTIGGVVIAGKSSMPVQSVSIIASPFLAVFAVVTLISGMILAYNILVFMFPNMNVFRVAGWFYVFLTLVVPMLAFMVGMMIESDEERAARFAREAEQMAEQSKLDTEKRIEEIHRQSEARVRSMPTPSRPLPQSFDERARSLRDRFGAERVAELHMEFVPPEKGKALYRHILELADVGNGAWSNSGNPVTMFLAPIDDLQAFADRIDFGEVLGVDTDARTIEIKIDPDKLSDAVGQ